MTTTERPLIVYHSGCWDGFCAAWVAHRWFRERGVECDFQPAQHGDDPREMGVEGRAVYLLDLTFQPTEAMFWLANVLAAAAYEERDATTGLFDPHQLGVLADALEEAGATSEELLQHLRGEQQTQKRCKCGGEYAPLKKDTLPLLSQCQKCREVGPFWADILTWEKGGEKCAKCFGEGQRYHADHDNGGGATLPCKRCGGTGRTLPMAHYLGCWAVDLVLGKS